MDIYTWFGIIVALVLIGRALEREIYFYEGVHLGPRLQAWLYDRWAKKYDADKRESQLHDDEMLAQPILDALQDVPEPFLLDFAAGTGRLSFALIIRPEFKGHILALDLSQGMLERAAAKLIPYLGRVDLLRHRSLPLPFPDAAFDAVCALEVLELFPHMDEPLAEFSRVLRPGGILLTSRGTEESGRRAKVKSEAEFAAILERTDFQNVQIMRWWKLFDRVIAVKKGSSRPAGAKKLFDVLQCPSCKMANFSALPDMLECTNCEKELMVTKEGIVLN